MTTNDHFFNNDKVQQLIVQFAFRIPTHRDLPIGERKALVEVLKDLDPSVFQLFDEQQKGMGPLFQVVRQLPVGATTVTFPSFILSNDSFIFFYPIKIMGQKLPGTDSLNGSNMNKKMSDWFMKVHDTISNSGCQRAGKIYEFVVGQFSHEEKKDIFNKLFAIELTDIGEMNLSFAHYVNNNELIYNVKTNMQYQQLELQHPVNIAVRVDINNRNLKTTMDPREIVEVWNFADTQIDTHLKDIFNL